MILGRCFGGVIVIALLAGCTAQPVADKATPSPTPNASAIYLKLMHRLPDFTDSDDASLLRLGHANCDELSQKDGWLLSVKDFTDHGYDAYEAGEAIQYSIELFCPDMQDAVPAR